MRNRWTDIFRKLLKRAPPGKPMDNPPAEHCTQTKLSRRKIWEAIPKQKVGKAPRSDGVSPESIKANLKTDSEMVCKKNVSQKRESHFIKFLKKHKEVQKLQWHHASIVFVPGKVLYRVILEKYTGQIAGRLASMAWEGQSLHKPHNWTAYYSRTVTGNWILRFTSLSLIAKRPITALTNSFCGR